MACFACGRQPSGAYPGIKYGKPLKEIYTEGANIHPYVEGLIRHAVTQKTNISLPATVTTRSLKKLRKTLKKPSDGLDFNRLRVSGHLALASVKDILDRLPAPLLVKNWQTATNWSKITKEIQYSSETLEDEDDDVSTDQQAANINKIKLALQSMDQVDLLMLKYVVALIKVLASDEVSVRPQRLIPLCAYYAEVLVSNKNRKLELKNVIKSLEYIVSNADEIFDCTVEELLVATKDHEKEKKVPEMTAWPPSALTLPTDMSLAASMAAERASDRSATSVSQRARSVSSAEPRKKSSKADYVDLAQQLAQVSYSATQPKKPFLPTQEQDEEDDDSLPRICITGHIPKGIYLSQTSSKLTDNASIFTDPGSISIKGLDVNDERLRENDVWNYLVDNMEQQISEARASLRYFPNLI
uniref:Rho-GAP domain-containing protein n=1 Tax=Strigamia maritima TaxID=126957 RepID=T1ING9_STRMM